MSKRILAVILTVCMVMTSVIHSQVDVYAADETFEAVNSEASATVQDESMIYSEEADISDNDAVNREISEAADESDTEELTEITEVSENESPDDSDYATPEVMEISDETALDAIEAVESVEVVEPVETATPLNASEGDAAWEELAELFATGSNALLGADAGMGSYGAIYVGDDCIILNSAAEAEEALKRIDNLSKNQIYVRVELNCDWNTDRFVRLNDSNESIVQIHLNGHKWQINDDYRLEIYNGKVEIENGTLTFTDTPAMPIHIFHQSELTITDVVFDHCVCRSWGKSALIGATQKEWANPDTPKPTVRVKRCTFNHCTGNQGSCFNLNEAGLFLEDCRFLHCSAESDGGAIYAYGKSWVDARNCVFMDCEAGGNGGVLWTLGSPFFRSIEWDNNIICRCKAKNGGAIYIKNAEKNYEFPFGINGYGTTLISDCKASRDGGAIYIEGPTTKIEGFTFCNNQAGEHGGAICRKNGEDGLILNNNDFAGNKAPKGGASLYADSTGVNLLHNRFTGDVYLLSDGSAEIEISEPQEFGNTRDNVFYSDRGMEELVSTKNPMPEVEIKGLASQKLPGDGTEAEPYRIESPDDWYRLAYNTVKGEVKEDEYYKLCTYIDKCYMGIGNENNPFRAHFDGDGRYVNLIMCNERGGVFSDTVNAHISNLIAKGTVFGNTVTGSIVGSAQGTTINNCKNYAVISNKSDSDVYLGGIAGRASATVINGCDNKGSILYGENGVNCGGICGILEGWSYIYNSLNHGSIVPASPLVSYAHIGGLAAQNDGGIFNSANLADIQSTIYAGGLCGKCSGAIGNCYQTGKVPKGIGNEAICYTFTGNKDNVSNCYFYYVRQGDYANDTKQLAISSSREIICDPLVIGRLNEHYKDVSYYYSGEQLAKEWFLKGDDDITFSDMDTVTVTLHFNTDQSNEHCVTVEGTTLKKLLEKVPVYPWKYHRETDWYTDAACTEANRWDPEAPITVDLDLWLKWIELRFEEDEIAYDVSLEDPTMVEVIPRLNGEPYSGALTIPEKVYHDDIEYRVGRIQDVGWKNQIDFIVFTAVTPPEVREGAIEVYKNPIYVRSDRLDAYRQAWAGTNWEKQLVGVSYLVSDIHNDLQEVSEELYTAETPVRIPDPDPKPGYLLLGWREYDKNWTQVETRWFTGGTIDHDTFIRPVWLAEEQLIKDQVNYRRYRITRDSKTEELSAELEFIADPELYKDELKIEQMLDLNEVTVSIDKLAYDVFNKAIDVKAITVDMAAPPKITGGSLLKPDRLEKVIVPKGSVNAYINAEGWENYKDIIIGSDESYVYVTYDYNSSRMPSETRKISAGQILTRPEDPYLYGYIFGGWYTNEECKGAQFDFSQKVYSDVCLYAKWTLGEKEHEIRSVSYEWAISSDSKSANCIATVYCNGGCVYDHPHSFQIESKAEVAVTPATCTKGTEYTYTAAFEPISCTERSKTQIQTQTRHVVAEDAPGHMFKKSDKLYHCCARDDCGVRERHTDENQDCICDVCGAAMYYEVVLHYDPYETEAAVSVAVADGWVVQIPQKQRPGRTSKWYEDRECTKLFFNLKEIHKDTELWEKVEDIEYRITWDAGEGVFSDGTREKQVTASYNDTPVPPENPSKGENYKFAGWSPEVEKVTSNTTYYADYVEAVPVTHTVVFDTNGGSYIAPQTVVDGSRAVRPDNPVKGGFTFTAWYKDEACSTPWLFKDNTVTEDITLYAGWAHDRLEITWNAAGGTFSSGLGRAITSVAYGKVPSAPEAPEKEGYQFVSWYPDLDTVTQNTEYTARYVETVPANVFVVDFDTNGGTEILPLTVAGGDRITRPDDPDKEGYTFGNWYQDETLETVWDFNTTVDKDITLYAGRIADNYDVTWDAGEGTFSDGKKLTTTSAAYGSIPEPCETPSKAGYKFAAWTPDINEVKGGDRYTAVYVKEVTEFFTVIFDTNCEERISPQRLAPGSYIVEPDIPHREGYQFTGWYTDEGCTDEWVFHSDTLPGKADGSGDSITLHAGWEIVKVKLIWNIRGDSYPVELDYGGMPSAEQIKAADTRAAEAVRDKEDVIFTGWDKVIEPLEEDTVYTAVYETFEKPVYWSIDEQGLLKIASGREEAGTSVDQGCFDGSREWFGQESKTWDNCRNKIKAVDVIGKAATDNPQGWFDGCANLKTVDLRGLDISGADSTERMFGDCTSLTAVNMKGCDFSGISEMSQMFEGCEKLERADFGEGAHISGVTSTWQMFAGCKSLKEVDISELTSKNLTCVSEMFLNCEALKTILVSEDHCPEYPSVEDGKRMFEGCTSLVGGKGTYYDSRRTGNEYAAVDKGARRKGYFTAKGSSPYVRFCYVYIDPCNGDKKDVQLVLNGEHAKAPDIPRKNGYTFVGWYASGESVKYDFADRVVDKSPLYINASWIKNNSDDPGEGGGSSSGKKLPSGTVYGDWAYDAASDTWTFTAGSYRYHDQWGLIYNPYAGAGKPHASWFHFDASGRMQTGWQWIKDKDGITRCYYLYPYSDKSGMRGACQLGGVTPDGYTVDASGAWTVNGVVQTK